MINVAKQQVSGLSSYTRKLQKFLHRAGDLSVIIGKQHLTGKNNVSCFVFVKSTGMNQLFYLAYISCSHSFQCRVSRKKCRRYEIHPRVRTLGGQAHGDHQFIVFLIVERAGSITVPLFQNGNNRAYFFFHGFFPSLCEMEVFHTISRFVKKGKKNQ